MLAATSDDTQEFVIAAEPSERRNAAVRAAVSARLVRRPEVSAQATGRYLLARLTAAEAAALKASGQVDAIGPNQQVRATATQISPPWGLDRIDSQTTTNSRYVYPSTAPNVTAYIVDTGVWAGHPDFGGRVRGGVSFAGGSPGQDCNGHGTHVAGTVGSRTYGVAKAIRIVPINVLRCNGFGDTYSIVNGFDWAIANHGTGPAVLNASIGSLSRDYLIEYAAERAIADGITVVAAAGNESRSACLTSPAAATNVITVAASDSSDSFASFSNWGRCVDIIAPGVFVMSTWPTGNWNFLHGTSMASPHVAGAAALWLAKYPRWTPRQVAAALTQRASRFEISGTVGATPNRLLFVDPRMTGPANDSFGRAVVLDPWASTTWYGDNVAATRQAGEPVHAGVSGGTSMWWKVSLPLPGVLAVDTHGSDFDTVLGVYRGSSVGALTRLAANDDASGSTSAVSPLLPKGTYYIAVDGFRGAMGSVAVRLVFTPQAAPFNDHFANAGNLGNGVGRITSSYTRRATLESAEPMHAGQSNNASVWWRLTPSRRGRLVAMTQGSTFDTELAAYHGSLGALTQVGSNDDTAFTRSQIEPVVTAGVPYSVAVDGFASNSGAVRLSTTVIPSATSFFVGRSPAARLFDTRPAIRGIAEPVDVRVPLVAHRAVRVTLPASVDPSHTGLVLSLQALAPASSGWLTVYPCASRTPAAASLFYAKSATSTGTAIVRPTARSFCIRSTSTTNVAVTLVGGLRSGSGLRLLNAPTRFLDTRRGARGVLESGADSSRPLALNEVRRYAVRGRGGLPTANVGAVYATVHVVAPTRAGTLKVWPCASISAKRPTIATISFPWSASAWAPVPTTADGGFCVQSSAPTHLIIDVVGSRGSSEGYVAVPAQTILDTRALSRGSSEFYTDFAAQIGIRPAKLVVGGAAGVPARGVASAVTMVATIESRAARGGFYAYPCNSASERGTHMAMGWHRAGSTTATILVPLGAGDAICLSATAAAHVRLTVVGWDAAKFEQQTVRISRGPQKFDCVDTPCSWFRLEGHGFSPNTAYPASCLHNGVSYWDFTATTDAAGSFVGETSCWFQGSSTFDVAFRMGGVTSPSERLSPGSIRNSAADDGEQKEPTPPEPSTASSEQGSGQVGGVEAGGG